MRFVVALNKYLRCRCYVIS